MKSKKTLGIVSLLSLSIFSNSVSMAIATTASAAAGTQSSAAADAKFSLIAKSLKKARKAIDSGAEQPKVAMAKFAEELVINDISVDDMDHFVLRTQTPRDYAKFQDAVAGAMNGVGNRAALSGREFAEVMGVAVRGASNDGLAWSGCGMNYAGVALLLGAVVVGIIALTKTKGSEKIKSDYQARKQAREKQYNDQRYDIENFQIVIPNQIVKINGQISAANQRIAYLQGQLSVLDPESADAIDAKNEIASKSKQVTAWNTQVLDLTLRMAFLSNYENRYAELTQLAIEYDADLRNLEQNEGTDVNMVPRNKKLAKTLGIVAGASAVLGTVLVVVDCE